LFQFLEEVGLAELNHMIAMSNQLDSAARDWTSQDVITWSWGQEASKSQKCKGKQIVVVLTAVSQRLYSGAHKY